MRRAESLAQARRKGQSRLAHEGRNALEERVKKGQNTGKIGLEARVSHTADREARPLRQNGPLAPKKIKKPLKDGSKKASSQAESI